VFEAAPIPILIAGAALVLCAWMGMTARRQRAERRRQEVLLAQERQRSRDALAAAEHEHQIARQVLRDMHEAVAVFDQDLRFVSVNPAFERVTGYAQAEVVGQPQHLLNTPHQEAGFCARVATTLRERGQWRGEVWKRRKNGERFLCRAEYRAAVHDGAHAPVYVALFHDITPQQQAQEQLRYLSEFDPLTDLPNRAQLSARLPQMLAGAQRGQRQVAVLFLNLDRFKDINDTFGYATGDRLLRAAAERLRQAIDPEHTLARIGGDEFAVVLESSDARSRSEALAQRILAAFDAPLQAGDGLDVTLSVSIGISQYPGHANAPDELLKQADTAMHEAKAAGRKTIVHYTRKIDTAARRRVTISGPLRKVLDRSELRLVWQPRLHLASSRITGVEVLLRWNNREHGEIRPVDFIPLAEESGMIMEIGEWVLREACRTLHHWHRLPLPKLKVSVNVSFLQLLRGDFSAVTQRILTETGMPANALELELTESMLLADTEQTISKLHALRALGVSLAIDDFGTGYSSLAYLKRLPVTTIKIDQSFTRDVLNDPRNAAITAAIIHMGHALGLNVVAEGVETDAQKHFLAGHACDEIQGFWLAKPLPADEAVAFIQHWSQMYPAPPPHPVRTLGGTSGLRSAARLASVAG